METCCKTNIVCFKHYFQVSSLSFLAQYFSLSLSATGRKWTADQINSCHLCTTLLMYFINHSRQWIASKYSHWCCFHFTLVVSLVPQWRYWPDLNHGASCVPNMAACKPLVCKVLSLRMQKLVGVLIAVSHHQRRKEFIRLSVLTVIVSISSVTWMHHLPAFVSVWMKCSWVQNLLHFFFV